MKYLIVPILFLAGCKSLNNVESVDLDLGGFEVEFYEPPPITIKFFGGFSKLRAPVDETMVFSSIWMPGKDTGDDPVAIIIFFVL